MPKDVYEICIELWKFKMGKNPKKKFDPLTYYFGLKKKKFDPLTYFDLKNPCLKNFSISSS